MNPNLKWKALFILAVILLCVYGLVGLPKFPTSLAQAKENFSRRIKLGLDLQGGTHLILQVQVQEAVAVTCDQTIDRLRDQLGRSNVKYDEVRRQDDTSILVKVNPDQIGAFREVYQNYFQAEWDLAPAPGEASGFLLTMKPAFLAALRTDTLNQSIETIRRRIDELGLTEPVVAAHGRGENEILVQLPGEGDPSRAKTVIQAGGQLELRRVAGERTFNSEAEAFASYNGKLPEGTELVRGRSEDRSAGGTGPIEVFYVLDRGPIVTGRDLPPGSIKVQPSSDYPGRYEVAFGLYKGAAARFGNFTEANVGRPMAIVLDRRVETAPTIESRIEDSGRITGRFTLDKANELSLILRAGSLPASVKYLEERTVGPSLGADSIRQGIQASVISLIAVMIFMVIYYRLSGVNAIVALILNLVMLLACLAYFGAVLTLPGIAGVILTIGMGVDSNVLVFERIREELRAGKANASAVDAGFDRAFLTIMDTHVTTVVSALFLFIFGTGPVRGFAVTLVLGLISNMFTAVYVSRTIFGWHLGRMSRQEALSI